MLGKMEFAILTACMAIVALNAFCGAGLLLFGQTRRQTRAGAAHAAAALVTAAVWLASDSMWAVAGVTLAVSTLITLWIDPDDYTPRRNRPRPEIDPRS